MAGNRNVPYSVLLAWDVNDIEEQGCFGTCVMANSQDRAIKKARDDMHASHCEDHDVPVGDPEQPEREEWAVLDVTRGANIWAAPSLLNALEEAVGILADYQGRDMVYKDEGFVEKDNFSKFDRAIEEGKGAIHA